jgi:hypothetical protein
MSEDLKDIFINIVFEVFSRFFLLIIPLIVVDTSGVVTVMLLLKSKLAGVVWTKVKSVAKSPIVLNAIDI